MTLTDHLESLFLRLLGERCGHERLSGPGRERIDEATRALRKSVEEALRRVGAERTKDDLYCDLVDRTIVKPVLNHLGAMVFDMYRHPLINVLGLRTFGQSVGRKRA